MKTLNLNKNLLAILAVILMVATSCKKESSTGGTYVQAAGNANLISYNSSPIRYNLDGSINTLDDLKYIYSQNEVLVKMGEYDWQHAYLNAAGYPTKMWVLENLRDTILIENTYNSSNQIQTSIIQFVSDLGLEFEIDLTYTWLNNNISKINAVDPSESDSPIEFSFNYDASQLDMRQNAYKKLIFTSYPLTSDYWGLLNYGGVLSKNLIKSFTISSDGVTDTYNLFYSRDASQNITEVIMKNNLGEIEDTDTYVWAN
ncbi:MAG: hypothetical protein K9H61_12410 [Bacteroidia bacterium]|nr:hypothetical protein [Bacteroidia bacterium]MCF8447787.1 hypothetical protein [Bacteroidia bacterium]